MAEDQVQIAVGHHVEEKGASLEVLFGADPGGETQAPHHRTIPQRGRHCFRVQQCSARDELIQPQVQAALVGYRGEHRVVFNDAAKGAAEGIKEIVRVFVDGFEATGAD